MEPTLQPKKLHTPDTLYTLLFYFSILLFIIGFNFTDSPPPSGWYQQFMPNLGGRQITDITFIDSLTGYAITNSNGQYDTAFILKTTDSGDNWFINYARTAWFTGFNRIKFLNLNTGFVCGVSVTSGPHGLTKTTNGGGNWFDLNVPDPTLTWYDMSVLNEDTVWLVNPGDLGGGVFRTTNGGINWERQINGLVNYPDKIYMYNRNIGFVSHYGASLYKTTNGGASWTVITGTDGFTDMRFVDNLTGFKCRSLMKKTTDGGLTWIQQTLPYGGNIIGSGMSKICYMSLEGDTLWGISGSIIAPGGVRGTLYHTTNGGINWTFQLPDTSIHIAEYYTGIFINSHYGWIYAYTTGIHTTTGGNGIFYTDVKSINKFVPTGYKLCQNYPNPFNITTKINFDLPKDIKVKIMVYDVLGREVIKLVDEFKKSGRYTVEFNGNVYASGVYFYRIEAGEFVLAKKMVLIK